MTEETTATINGHACTVGDMLKDKYSVDVYQREYAWQERQVVDLVRDLANRFLTFYEEAHAPSQVASYGHYFLGPVVICRKQGRRYIVDGQQRLTTLTLLLILLHRTHTPGEGREIRSLIYSEKYRERSFNLDIPERETVMAKLLNGEPVDRDQLGEATRNLVDRYRDLAEQLGNELTKEALPYFLDWLLDSVHFVVIEARSDEDAYTIFETMNDRGLKLSLPDMLKSYLLANVLPDSRGAVNDLWKKRIGQLKALGEEADIDFFKDWLRAQYAQSIRPGGKGAENEDFERIGTELHRWVRENKEPIGLCNPESYKLFVTRDMSFYAHYAVVVAKASMKPAEGMEAVFYNADRGFTLQGQLLLAPLTPDDSEADARKKISMVADCLDIWLARRIWCFKTVGYSSVRYTLFNLTKEIRRQGLAELSTTLRRFLDAQEESFAGNPYFRLHQQNQRQVRHILARLTHWLDRQCDFECHFTDLVASDGRSRAYEIEHIWPNKPERFADVYPQLTDFEEARNRIGGLVLLRRLTNQSLGDKDFEKKRDAYVMQGQSLLIRSLHPGAYQNSPQVRGLLERTGLQLKPYDTFGQQQQAERQELYIRIAEWVWNPSRLDLDGLKPPEPQPLDYESKPFKASSRLITPDEAKNERARELSEPRFDERRAFWTLFLEHAAGHHSLGRIKPHSHGSTGFPAPLEGRSQYCYVITRDAMRVELYIDVLNVERNKEIFDDLHLDRLEIEERFGSPLLWERLDAKQACRVSYTLNNGGWADRTTWDRVIADSVQAMQRLQKALRPSLERLDD